MQQTVLTSTTLHEHWGVIWGTFETLVGDVRTKNLMNDIKWRIPKKLILKKGEDEGNVFMINIFSYPDVQNKILEMQYLMKEDDNEEIQQKVKMYGMNQYFKSIPLKTSILSDQPYSVRVKTTDIPTYINTNLVQECSKKRKLILLFLLYMYL